MADSEETLLRTAHAQVRAAQLDRHIAFVGFMGAGKSTLAAITASALSRECVDSDERVVQRAGQSIEELFATRQEGWFRQLEREVIEELLGSEPAVLSLGGGALDDVRTRKQLFARAFVVNLVVSWREVKEELPTLQLTRRLLRDRSEAEIHDLFLRRQAAYRLCHLRIRMQRGDPQAAAAELLSILRK